MLPTLSLAFLLLSAPLILFAILSLELTQSLPLLVVFLLLALSLLWNRRLHKEIALRKAVEVELLAARKNAEEADNAKSEFLAKMSHEIRTPMNGVLGMAELLENTPLDERQQQYVRTIQRSGNTLMVVINDILDYSRIEAGRMAIAKAPFDLNDLIEETVVPYQLMPDSEVCLEVYIAPDVPVYLKGDSVRLHQVLSNLLNNAFKFTFRGMVSLEIDLEAMSDREATLHFRIADTGVGIDPVTQKVLFQSFTQADQSTARKYGGSGLGLAICKRLIELMGGRITLASELGRGSRFDFSIRFELERKVEAADNRPKAKEDYSHLRVLLAEDNLVNQLVVKEFMRKLAVQLCVVADGAAAVEMVCGHERHFDLILMDCEMPKMDGYEATRRIRQWESDNRKYHSLICALTAHVLPEHITKCLQSGMDSHIAKPLKLNALIGLLGQINPAHVQQEQGIAQTRH